MKLNLNKLRQKALYLFCLIATLIVALISIFPLLWMLSTSFKPYDEVYASPPTLLPVRSTLKNYSELLTLTHFPVYFWNSTLVAGSATVLSVIIGAFGAYSVSRLRSRAARYFSRLVLITYMFPRILLVIPLFVIIIKIGLTNTRIGLALTYVTFTLPFALWMLRSYFDAIPIELEEAAMVDGASRWRTFCLIVLPLALPGMIATSIFSFITAWNEYLFALVFISSDSYRTLPLGIAILFGGTGMFSWGMLMAASVFVTVPVIIFFVFIQKRLISGYMAGAVKG
jgi:ABC-type glycerol-3-phosphate transport system permease component